MTTWCALGLKPPALERFRIALRFTRHGFFCFDRMTEFDAAADSNHKINKSLSMSLHAGDLCLRLAKIAAVDYTVWGGWRQNLSSQRYGLVQVQIHRVGWRQTQI